MVEPLDLSKQPPRSPKVELDGVVMLARTIDKLRASLPGGNMGVYKIEGFSQRMLDAIGVSEVQLRDVVAKAETDEDVAKWLRAQTDRAKLEEVSTLIRNRNIDDVTDLEKFKERYPILKKRPDIYHLTDMLEADDAEMFGEQASMYAVIREFKVKPGMMERAIGDFHAQMVPLIQKILGFSSYSVATPNDTELVSVSFFKDKAGADESTRVALDLVKRVFSDIVDGAARIMTGPMVIHEGDPGRQTRYGTLRRFTVKPEQLASVARRVHDGLVPILRSAPGFVAFSGIDCGNGVIVSLGTFETRESADAAAQRGMEWAEVAMRDLPEPELVFHGQFVVRVDNEEALASL